MLQQAKVRLFHLDTLAIIRFMAVETPGKELVNSQRLSVCAHWLTLTLSICS